MTMVRKGQPTQSDVHVDAMLTNIAVAYMQSQSVFIATKVFPVVPVDKQTDKYWVLPKNDWLRDEARKRADATESVGSGFTLSSDSYYADVWAIHKDLGSQTRANADASLSLETAATQFVTRRILLRQEIQWVSDFFTTQVWGTDYTPANLWSDYTNSDPIEDIETAKEAILGVTGYEPNTLVLGYQTFRKLKHHPDITDRIKFTTAQSITPQMLAAIFEVPNIYVAKAIKATNLEGETAAYAFTHGKHAWLGYVTPTPSMFEPTAGYTFGWTGVSGGIGATVGVDSFEIRKLKAMRYEAEAAWDNKVVGSDLGYFFNSVVA